MVKKSVATAETVYAAYVQLGDHERERFREICGWSREICGLENFRRKAAAIIDDLATTIMEGKKEHAKHTTALIAVCKEFALQVQRMKTRKRPSTDKHNRWRELKTAGKSLEQIKQIHKRETGETITIRAITKVVNAK